MSTFLSAWSSPIPRAALLGLILVLPAAAEAQARHDKPSASQGESDAAEDSTDQPAADPTPSPEGTIPTDNPQATLFPTEATIPPAGVEPTPAGVTDGEYRVRPGDTLRVTVWKEPEMSGDVTVRPDGKVTVPLLGDVNAWLRTPRQLSGTIAEGLARFVDEPQVTVAILQANSARFFIIGQVVKPGVYPLAGQISVLQAIALSGGFTPFAKRNKMRLFRGVDGSEGVTPIDFEKLSAGDIRQNFVLQPGDTLVVP